MHFNAMTHLALFAMIALSWAPSASALEANSSDEGHNEGHSERIKLFGAGSKDSLAATMQQMTLSQALALFYNHSAASQSLKSLITSSMKGESSDAGFLRKAGFATDKKSFGQSEENAHGDDRGGGDQARPGANEMHGVL